MNGERVIDVHKVSKSYDGLKAVKELSFSVNKSECFGLLGPNGAGKTTMMKMIYGKAKRDNTPESAMSVMGFDPKTHNLEIKAQSGVVPQEDNLDTELTVRQNLLIYSRFYGMKKKDALAKIEELLDFMELQDKINVRIRELSGGMKRRLVIARSLLHSPKLLILDDY